MSRDYREIQVSTSVLVFIILGILILGTVIFFIGVQVGKKQADLMSQTLISQKTAEKVSPPSPVPPREDQTASLKEQATSTRSAETAGLHSISGSQKPASETAPESSLAVTTSSPQSSSPPPETKPPARTSTSISQKPATTTKLRGVSFFIQVGAFNDRSSAKLAAERYKKQGHTAVVKEPFPKDRKPLYRVWLGSYQTREEAQKVLNELASKSVRHPGFFIIQQ
jgi:cell division septation protein DedD